MYSPLKSLKALPDTYSCTKKINPEKISKDSRKVICRFTWLEKTKDGLTQLEKFMRKYKPDYLIIQTRVDKLPSNYPTEMTQRSMDLFIQTRCHLPTLV